MIGYLTQINFEPGKTPEPDTWFKPAGFMNENWRLTQVDTLDGLGIVNVLIRFESGRSNTFRPDSFENRYLVHGTNEKKIASIRRMGLVEVATMFILLSTTA